MWIRSRYRKSLWRKMILPLQQHKGHLQSSELNMKMMMETGNQLYGDNDIYVIRKQDMAIKCILN